MPKPDPDHRNARTVSDAAEARNLGSTGQRSDDTAGPRTPGEDRNIDLTHNPPPPEATNRDHPTAPGTHATVPGEGLVTPATAAGTGRGDTEAAPQGAPGAMRTAASVGGPAGPPTPEVGDLTPPQASNVAPPAGGGAPDRALDPGDVQRVRGTAEPPGSARGTDQLPVAGTDVDMGAAGGGATGPGNAEPNWTGANTGGAVAGPGTGGVAIMDTGVGRFDQGEEAEMRAGSRHGRAQLVRDVMTAAIEVCTPGTNLQYVARMMADRDCGAIPVVENTDTMRPIGIITDRDITIRVVAKGQNPFELRAADCMSTSLLTIHPDTSIEECVRLMEQRQVRRLPVVDTNDRCIGIISLADIAIYAPRDETAELVREVSEPAHPGSQGLYH